MKSSIKILTLLFCMCLPSAWGAKVSLKGHLVNASGEDSAYLYSAMDRKQSVPLASAVIDAKGNFEFAYQPKSIGFFTLQFHNAKSVLCVLKPNSTVGLTIDARTGMLLRVENTPENLLLQQYQQKLIDLDKRKKALLEAHKDKASPRFEADLDQLEKERMLSIVTLCSNNLKNYGSAALLEYLDVDTYQEVYEQVLTPLMKSYKNDAYLQHKYEQLQLSKSLSPGNPAPLFSLSDTNGRVVNLSDYKGKAVLLDFWASWCPDCRKVSAFMTYLYQTYHNAGLEFIGISLDTDKQRWLEAIRADQLTWTHVSELQGWKCEAAAAYNVNWIPTVVLIDKDGKIVARGLEGKALESKIKEMLK